MGIETAIIAGLAVGGAGLGAYSSMQQAKAANKYREQQQAYYGQVQAAQTRAARIQERQIKAQSALEKQKTARMGHQIRSTLRVAAGEPGGVGLGGTYEALMRQADLDQAINMEIISRNAQMAAESAYSRIQPTPPVQAGQNETLAAILGGLGGMQSGLSLGASGMSMFGPGGTLRTPPPTGGSQAAPSYGTGVGATAGAVGAY